ncbi:MAG: multicopper oxidase domain-containing protein, partial [Chloroflexi bacterium]|nr:multicopper oxidase domain-containing protein [Chloroflexota bacterium]
MTALAMVIGIWVLIEATSSARAAVTTSEIGLRSVCPPEANVVTFNVAAINVDITLNRHGDHDPKGRMYVLEQDIAAVRAQEHAPLPDRVSIGLRDDPIQPLIIRANLGDCVHINLKNQLQGERASVHFHRGVIDPANGGDNVGNNADSTIGPGESATYTVYIPDRPEMEGTFYFHSHGDAREQVMHGLMGGLVAEPNGSVYLHPDTLMPMRSGWEAVIGNEDSSIPSFREQALVYHEVGDETYQPLDKNNQALPVIDPTTGSYRPCARAINYRSECFMRRMQLTGEESLAYSSYHAGDPPTPMPRSYVGDPMKTRLIHGGSEMAHVHHLHGGSDRWRLQPNTEAPDVMFKGLVKQPLDVVSKSQRLDAQSIGPGETYNLEHEC